MPWDWLSRLVSPGENAADDADVQDVDDELMFHFQSLIEDDMAKGMTLSDAWQSARRKFGSLPHYSRRCRDLDAISRRRLWSAGAVGAVLVLCIVGWTMIQVRTMRLLLRQELAAASAAAAAKHSGDAEWKDFEGQVLDCNDHPLPRADVLVVVKTWPHGVYRQQASCLRTDDEGRFRLVGAVPAKGQSAVHLTAYKSGYAFTSIYQQRSATSESPFAASAVRLPTAAAVTLVVHDEAGRPAVARVAPQWRRSPSGEDHLVYFQASEPVQQTTDAMGRIELACFEPGDRAEIYLQLPGRDWVRRTVEIPKDGNVVVVSTPAGGS
jgi:hypothetical protein